MDDELRIGVAAEFVEVHSNALAVCIDAEGQDAIERKEEQIGKGKNQSEQGRHCDQLGQELTTCGGEAACGNEPPEAAGGVD